MNNFIYENSTKVYFGQGCVREFLTSLVKDYDTVMMAYGQGSVKRNGIYDEILLRYLVKHFEGPVEETLKLWKRAMGFGVDCYQLEEKILAGRDKT